MKKLLLFSLLLCAVSFGCSTSSSSDDSFDTSSPSSSTSGCGSYNGHTLHKGEQGGCYYINSNGNKTYVDRSYCKC